MFANLWVKSRSTMAIWSKFYYRNNEIGASNYDFFYQEKVHENFKIALNRSGR